MVWAVTCGAVYTDCMQWLVGIDEAGRGPLAGPVAVGVFAVTVDFDRKTLAGIRDSKVLSERQREEWSRRISQLPAIRSVALVGASHIDRYGIVRAINTAMVRALKRLPASPEDCLVLLDGGLRAPSEYTAQHTIVRGDATEPLISAAAILAKVARDHYLRTQAKRFPEYGFEVHKGYGTVAHRAMIEQYGLCPLHRRTFCHPRAHQLQGRISPC